MQRVTHKTRIIVNRQEAAKNRKYTRTKDKLNRKIYPP